MIKTEFGSYKPIIEIQDIEDFREDGDAAVFGDRRDGKLYRYTYEVKLSINVALATGRPLLIIGETGCGKSSLAFNLARIMGRRYYEYVVTSRSQARDLFYRFDAVRRLGDSQLRLFSNPVTEGNSTDSNPIWHMQYPYLEPGRLWWIFDPSGAQRRGYFDEDTLPFSRAVDPVVWQPDNSPNASSILLIDEIDKADPDFPNNLLVPLGSRQFFVDEIAKSIYLNTATKNCDPITQPLIIITSNQQRELPDTFLRRCIVLEIPSPTSDELVSLAKTTFRSFNDKFYKNIAIRLEEMHGKQLSVAEFLDSVQAIEKLSASGSALSEIIERSSWRSGEP